MKPLPTRELAEAGWDAWLERQSPTYRQAAYRGRAEARRQLLDQTSDDHEQRIHHDRIGTYEARAEAAK
jgi:hypothetical protein